MDEHEPPEMHLAEEHPGVHAANDVEHSRVGYKKPPVHSRFQKGQRSGNPKGRPKREAGWSELFRNELNKKIWIRENGRPARISKRRAWMSGWQTARSNESPIR